MKLRYLTLVAAATALGLAAGVTSFGFGFRPIASVVAAPCAGNPCASNPCAAKSNPCAGNPCASNPCAAKSNPCAGNPCASNPCAAKSNPCAGNPCAGNPCAGSAQAEEADVEAAMMPDAEFDLVVSDGNVIELTQTSCQFLESEGANLDFEAASAEDCKQINSETADSRTAQPLTIPAGDYTFRVTNEGVPYEVGFYLRGAGLTGLTLPKVSGGGLFEGDTQDYTVSLKPGEYVYSCPLNPTLRYPLTVTES